MQEEVENRTLTLIVSGDKVHRAAVQGRHIQVHGPPQGEKAGKAARAGIPPSPPKGKQTVKQLIGQKPGRLQHRDQRPVHQGF